MYSLYSAQETASRKANESSWRNESWLNAYPLNKLTVLDYFKNSPFYVLTCNNEQVIMHAPNTTGSTITSIADRLKRLVGLEFEVDASNDPNYFVIRRQWRVSPNQVHVEAMYYVIGVDAGSPPANVTMNDPQDIQVQSSAFATVLQRGTVIPLPCFGQVIDTAMYTVLMRMNRAADRFGELMHLRNEALIECKRIREPEADLTVRQQLNEDTDEETKQIALIDSLTTQSARTSKARTGYSHLVDQALQALIPRPTQSRTKPR